jgi:hypothetical protein
VPDTFQVRRIGASASKDRACEEFDAASWGGARRGERDRRELHVHHERRDREDVERALFDLSDHRHAGCLRLHSALHHARREGTLAHLRVRHPVLVFLRGLMAGLGTIFGFYAFSVLPLADVYSIAFCAPLVVTLASIPILGSRWESVGSPQWVLVSWASS